MNASKNALLTDVQELDEEGPKEDDLPPSFKKNLERENQVLDEVIERYSQGYLGTDPVEDAARLFKEQKLKQAQSVDSEPKDTQKVDPFD